MMAWTHINADETRLSSGWISENQDDEWQIAQAKEG